MKNALALLCTLVAAVASAAQFSDFYVIPAAAHAPGVNGTTWRTDVAIQNFQTTPININMALVETGEGLTNNVNPVGSPVVVPAGTTVILPDVLNNYRGLASSSGALLVGGDKAFAITSRTYNLTAAGTLGQTVSASGDVASDMNTVLYLPGLVQNAKFRTNIGLVMSAGAQALAVSVTVNNGTRTFIVQPGVTTHVQFPATTVSPSSFDAAGGTVMITAGTGTVVAYASVVDDGTGDASFIAGGSTAAGGVSPLRDLMTR